MRRVLQDGGFRSDWGNPDYDPIGDFRETAGDEYRIPLLKVLLREQLESRYEVANHFSTMNRARVELSAFIQNEGGAPLPEDALGTPEEQGIRAMLIATGEPPREMTLLPDKNGSTLKPLQALVGGNIETFDIAFGEGVSLYVNEEGLFTCPPNRAIFATEEMAKAGYLSQLDYSKVVEMGDFYTVLNGDIVAVGFDPETGESRSLTDGETARVEGSITYKTVHHDAVTHTEHVAPVYQNLTTYHTVCNECKQVIDGKADDHIKQTGHSGYSTNVPITDEVMVSEGYDKQVTDTPAYDETVIDKLVCTTCGATKDAPQATSDAAK